MHWACAATGRSPKKSQWMQCAGHPLSLTERQDGPGSHQLGGYVHSGSAEKMRRPSAGFRVEVEGRAHVFAFILPENKGLFNLQPRSTPNAPHHLHP